MHLAFSHVSLSFQQSSNITFSQLCSSQISVPMRGRGGFHLSEGDSLAAVLGLHRGDATSPGDTSQNERPSGVANLEGVESAVPVCPREAGKLGSAQRGGLLANWVP